MRDAPEGRGTEAPVIGDIVAPDDLPAGEHFVERTEVGHGQRARGQGFHGVARHDVGGDGAELACLPVEEVGRDRFGSRQSPKLVADQATRATARSPVASRSRASSASRALGDAGEPPGPEEPGATAGVGLAVKSLIAGTVQYTRAEPGRTAGLLHPHGLIPRAAW